MTDLAHSFNLFNSYVDNQLSYMDMTGPTARQSSNYLNSGIVYRKNDIVNAVISRIALDASMVEFKHYKVDKITGNQSPVESELIDRFTIEANIDQTGRSFIYDAIWSMLDEGVVALVPIETSSDPDESSQFKIYSMRVGKIEQWYPEHVRVLCYNERTGLRQSLVVSKRNCVIVESPLQATLANNNSTLNLLQKKIDLMVQEESKLASGKINGFIQFPYMSNSTRRIEMANRRRKELENEMANNQYGLATLDSNEKFIPTGQQLQNNLMDDVLRLKQDFYDQVGITENVLKGTAGESEMNMYYVRTIDPVLTAIVDGINRTFLTKTARSQGQTVRYFRDPFKTVPAEQIANISDILTRNAIFTPNEVRPILGKEPHPNPIADKLFNRNIADAHQNGGIDTPGQDFTNPNDPNSPPIYSDGRGGYVDADGYPVDEYGKPL